MGLYAPGRDPRRVDPVAIAEAMRPALTQWFSALIRIEDPKMMTTTPYDPLTDSGGVAVPLLIHEGRALVQPLTGATTTEIGSQEVSVGAVRIQMTVPDTVELRSGLRIRVLESTNDRILQLRSMSLDDVATGSLAWEKILMARVLGS